MTSDPWTQPAASLAWLPTLLSRWPVTPVAVRREDVLELLARGAQALEVLSAAEFTAAHLPGAVHIPLPALNAETAAQLAPDKPVITYCSHAESDLSARAAWRLVSLGFSHVFRYTRGKADWLANGLPIEGSTQPAATAASLARPDVPTCRPEALIEQVLPTLLAAAWDMCVVVNDHGVVLGRLGRAALAGDPHATAEQVMEAGPVTVRANANLRQLAGALRLSGAGGVLVTTSAGQLVGHLSREGIERWLHSAAAGLGLAAGG